MQKYDVEKQKADANRNLATAVPLLEGSPHDNPQACELKNVYNPTTIPIEDHVIVAKKPARLVLAMPPETDSEELISPRLVLAATPDALKEGSNPFEIPDVDANGDFSQTVSWHTDGGRDGEDSVKVETDI